MKDFWKMLFTLIAEHDGKSLSHRKVIAFVFMMYTFFMMYATYKTNNGDLYSDVQWMAVVGGALGISYIRQISNLKSPKNESD